MNASKIITCFALCLALWLGGLIWFCARIPAAPLAGNRKADAIVVLTGGNGRLEYGLELLAGGEGRELFVSGVSKDLTVEQLLRQAPANLRARLTPADRRHIALGHDARNTIGNADETVRWLKQQHYRSILLVTANYHMPRSIEEFEEIAPDIAIIPAPVFSDNFRLDGWWNDAGSRILMLSEYHKYLASEIRHWIISVLHRS